MIVLDTNVISELMRDPPHPAVVRWSATLAVATTAVTAVNVFEIDKGLAVMPAGPQRTGLEELFDDLLSVQVGVCFDFDLPAAEEAAAYLAERRRMGRRLDDNCDAQIAGIVRRLERRDGVNVTLATRNLNDFIGLPVVNPWTY